MLETSSGAGHQPELRSVTHCPRFQFCGIKDRRLYSWPKDRKLAVFLALNIEVFSYDDSNNAGLTGTQPAPNVSAYGWKEYGNRVGAWRILDLLREFHMHCAVQLNSLVYSHCPELVAFSDSLGNDVVAHSRTNSERQGTKSESDEMALIKEVTATIKQHEGKAPLGWLGAGLSESMVTPDLLAEAGYRYVMDYGCMDDQPIWINTRSGKKLLAIPYAQDLNDLGAILVRHWTYKQYADAVIDAFDEMLLQAREGEDALVMPIAIHAFLMGQPCALPHLRRVLAHIASCIQDDIWLTTPDAIFRHIEQLPAGTVPGDDKFHKTQRYLHQSAGGCRGD
ncbi:hypothetical protein WJX73_000644 [Symbiochloris irregularis]|uniref:Polysaccharide deacetylase n=1 Tax=Symbiochloris irregularis TaxID=706552 RepID=A0AAW1PVG5_9CHLO